MAVGKTPPKGAVSLVLPIEPTSAERARRALRRYRDVLDASRLVDLQLIVSELVVEAIQAPSSADVTLGLQAEIRGERLHVEVVAHGDGYWTMSQRAKASPLRQALQLMEALAERSGIRREPDMTSAWLEIGLRASRGTAEAPR